MSTTIPQRSSLGSYHRRQAWTPIVLVYRGEWYVGAIIEGTKIGILDCSAMSIRSWHFMPHGTHFYRWLLLTTCLPEKYRSSLMTARAGVSSLSTKGYEHSTKKQYIPCFNSRTQPASPFPSSLVRNWLISLARWADWFPSERRRDCKVLSSAPHSVSPRYASRTWYVPIICSYVFRPRFHRTIPTRYTQFNTNTRMPFLRTMKLLLT